MWNVCVTSKMCKDLVTNETHNNIFIYLKLWVAAATHNLKRIKNTDSRTTRVEWRANIGTTSQALAQRWFSVEPQAFRHTVYLSFLRRVPTHLIMTGSDVFFSGKMTTGQLRLTTMLPGPQQRWPIKSAL